MPLEPKVEYVSKDIIRHIFNQDQYLEKVKSGIYSQKLRKSSHIEYPPKCEPYCTCSQLLAYFTRSNRLIALVHQYLRPDGTLGASGKPDPKRLFLQDKILAAREE